MAMWTTSVAIPLAYAGQVFGVKLGEDVWLLIDNYCYRKAMEVHVYNHESLNIKKINTNFSESVGSISSCQSHNKNIFVSASKFGISTPNEHNGFYLFKLDTSTLKWENVMKFDEFFQSFVIMKANLFYIRFGERFGKRFDSIIRINMEQKEEKKVITWDQKHTCCKRVQSVKALALLDNQLYMMERCPTTKVSSVYNLYKNEFLRYQGNTHEILARLHTVNIGYFDGEVELNDFNDFCGGEVECTIFSMNNLTNCYEEISLHNWCQPKEKENRLSFLSHVVFNNGLIHVILKQKIGDKFVIRTIDCKPTLSTICYRDMVESIVWKQQELEDVLKSVPFPHRKRFKKMLKWKEEQRDAYGEEQRVQEEV